jgi:hypothetical protein
LCKFTREISNVENVHDLNVFFYTSSKKSTFKAGNKAQIHMIFFNRVYVSKLRSIMYQKSVNLLSKSHVQITLSVPTLLMSIEHIDGSVQISLILIKITPVQVKTTHG